MLTPNRLYLFCDFDVILPSTAIISIMPPMNNKLRLHLALYGHGRSATTDHLNNTCMYTNRLESSDLLISSTLTRYHWALIIGPKEENEKSQGTQLHVQDHMQTGGTSQWSFEERDITITATNMLLIHVTIAKILDLDWTLNIIHAVPPRPESDGWTCWSWVREAMASLDVDGEAFGMQVMDWNTVSKKAVLYCEEKTAADRFHSEGSSNTKYPPTWDLTVGDGGREVTP